jgi:hypothetical protein
METQTALQIAMTAIEQNNFEINVLKCTEDSILDAISKQREIIGNKIDRLREINELKLVDICEDLFKVNHVYCEKEVNDNKTIFKFVKITGLNKARQRVEVLKTYVKLHDVYAAKEINNVATAYTCKDFFTDFIENKNGKTCLLGDHGHLIAHSTDGNETNERILYRYVSEVTNNLLGMYNFFNQPQNTNANASTTE